METKTLPSFTKAIEDRTVTGIFAVHGNIDDGRDRSWPGSFANTTMNGRSRARFLWMHNGMEPPIATIANMREVTRDELPTAVLSYAPEATGGVEVSRTYLETPRANEVFAGIKAGAIDEMSYAYDVTRSDFEDVDGDQIRNIREVKLYDISDVNWGMNPATVGSKGLVLEGLPLGAQGEMAKAYIDAFVAGMNELKDRRVKEGRVLSDANRKLIADTTDALDAAIKALRALLAAAEPAPKNLNDIRHLRAMSRELRAHAITLGVFQS